MIFSQRVALFLLGLGFGLGGCGSYQPGAGYVSPFKTIHLADFETEAFSPGMAQAVREALVRSLEKDGRVRLVPEAEAEVVLQVRLTDFSEEISAFSPADSGRPVSMRNRVTARLDLGPPNEPTAFLEGQLVTAEIRLFSPEESSFQAARFQSQPALVARLAERIRDATLRVAPAGEAW